MSATNPANPASPPSQTSTPEPLVLHELAQHLQALAVFRGLLDDPALSALLRLLQAHGSIDEQLAAYGAFAAALYAAGHDDLHAHLRSLVEADENAYIRCIGRGDTPTPHWRQSAEHELGVLQAVGCLTPDDLRRHMGGYRGFLPGFRSGGDDLAQTYEQRVANIGRCGYGIYAQHHMFCLDDAGHIQPVSHPDPIRLSQLVDYKREQKIILDNTQALLQGKPAANMLLTGDAGTGKSSTVKAVVNELWPQGLRIVQLRKEQLELIPTLLDELSQNPLKFILFVDDLSFQKGDDRFTGLKAILEGSVSARSRNVVIYATSNRRHLVNERFSDRDGDEIHRNDTMQELMSLSERFGIRVTFQRPDKATYLHIVHHLAQQEGLQVPPQQLDEQAERFALQRGTRSARAARQFIDLLLTGQHV